MMCLVWKNDFEGFEFRRSIWNQTDLDLEGIVILCVSDLQYLEWNGIIFFRNNLQNQIINNYKNNHVTISLNDQYKTTVLNIFKTLLNTSPTRSREIPTTSYPYELKLFYLDKFVYPRQGRRWVWEGGRLTLICLRWLNRNK